MPKFAANLTMLFNEVGFLERFDAAAKAGFKGVEYLFPYDFQPDEIVAKLKANNLTQVLHNLPAGDWAGGERGIAVLPDRVEEFKQGVDKAITYATALGCKQVNCLAGIPKGVDAATAHKTLVANLKYAAPKLKAAGIKLLVEAINTRDIPGFFVTSTKQCARDPRRSRLGQSLRPVRHLSHADHGGRSRPHDRGEPRADRAHPARR